jgi:hypothetical protein
MRDKRFILILLAVSLPVVAWLTVEYMAVADQAAQRLQDVRARQVRPPSPMTNVAPLAEPAAKSPEKPAAAAKPNVPKPAAVTTVDPIYKATAKAKLKEDGPAEAPDSPEPIAAAPHTQAKAIAAAVTPARPRSPEDLCADRANFITRGLCESRACNTAEWSAHPFCVKRRELEEKSRPSSIMGGSN